MPPCDSSTHCLPALRPTAPWPAASARGPSPGNPHNPGDRRSASFRPACQLATPQRIVCRPCGHLRHGPQYLPRAEPPEPPHNGRSPAIGQLPSRATAAIATLPAHCQPGIVGRLGHHLLMRPALKPGLLPVWRNRDTIQIGIDPRRAIALTGMRRAAGLLRLLDGSRDRAQVLGAARELGMDPEMVDRVLGLLAVGGALDDIPARS